MELKQGDIVRYTAAFLKSAQWTTDVPDDGIVQRVVKYSSMTVAHVAWPNDTEPTRSTNVKNLVLKSRSHLEAV